MANEVAHWPPGRRCSPTFAHRRSAKAVAVSIWYSSGARLQDEQAKLTALSTEVFWHLYDEFLSLEKRLAHDVEKF